MEMTEKQKKLLDQLNDISNEMDTLLDDESVTSLPKAFNKIKDKVDEVAQGVEDGEYLESTPETD